MSDPVESLTEAQKQVLRLLYGRMNAKQIAAELGISPDTVHQRLAAARKKLSVARSNDAARILAAAEGAPIYDHSVYGELDVAEQPTPPTYGWQSYLPWPGTTRWGKKNDLTFAKRVMAVVMVASLCMGGSGLLLLAIHLLSQR